MNEIENSFIMIKRNIFSFIQFQIRKQSKHDARKSNLHLHNYMLNQSSINEDESLDEFSFTREMNILIS